MQRHEATMHIRLRFNSRVATFALAAFLMGAVANVTWAELSEWNDRLTFHASFDTTADADTAAGDPRIYTATDSSRENVQPGLSNSTVVARAGGGRWGECLYFRDTSKSVVFFQGKDNIPYSKTDCDLTISFWMRLNPDEDLKPGYVDPLQITDKKWNDSSLFVDFTKDDSPRHFRLGVFADYAFWNPTDTQWDDVADSDRPLITVRQTPFSRDRWTHVAITLKGINNDQQDAISMLYLTGTPQGQLVRRQQFTWAPDRVAIMLGIQYIGYLDDFAVFRGAMTAQDVRALADLDGGISRLGE